MKTEGRIEEVRRETHDVKTFTMELEESIEFTSGQYCLLSILSKPGYDSAEKPFTFANAPSQEGNSTIEITIKRVGDFTTAMHSLDVGKRLEIDGPYGEELNFDRSTDDDIVFLVGGSGITPFISSLRYLIENDLDNHITLLFSNRMESDIIYKEELERMDERDNITVVNTLTHEKPDYWARKTGRIDREMIDKYVNNPEERLWYICGPPGMVEAMNDLLTEMNIPSGKVRWEDWQLPGKYN